MKNYIYVIMRSILGGMSNSINRLVVNDLPIYPFLFFRYIGMSILSLFFNDKSQIKEDIQVLKTNHKVRNQMLVSCLINMIGTVLFFIALKELPVSIVSIYENGLYTILTIVLAVWILKEKIQKGAVWYLSFCIVGLVLIVTKGKMELPEISMLGIGLLSLNALLSSITTTIEMFNLKSLSIFTITFLKSFITGLLMLGFSFAFQQSITEFFTLMKIWLAVFFIYSVINSFAIKYLQLKSMKVLNSSKTAIFQLITPVLSTIFAMIIFKEPLVLVQWIGIIIIVYSVFKLQKKPKT